jgi:flagellar motility protein MotE (MotC chaperone)
MRGLKLILILAGLGVVAFGAAFFVSRQFGTTKSAQAVTAATTAEASAEAAKPAEGGADVPRLEEKHLYELIKEVRQKVGECEKREASIAEQEKRVQISHQVLEKEAQDLEALRIRLASAASRSKEAQAELEKTRIAIDKEEVANLKRVAGVYDKMDATAAGRIIEGLCANQQDTDAARILHFMTDRSVAKLLAEITDKNLASRLVESLKRIKEQG